MNKLIAFLKEQFDRRLSRIKETLAELIAVGDKSPAPEEAPLRSPSELKILAEVLKGTLQKNPKDLKALYNLGEVYVAMHRYGEAITPLRELIKIAPDHKSGRLQLGRAQMEMGRDESALENLEEALRLDPSFSDGYEAVGVMLGRSERFHEAIDIFKRLGLTVEKVHIFNFDHQALIIVRICNLHSNGI